VLFCAGFLLCTLWIDLKFDVLLLGQTEQMPEAVLAEVAAYYHRVISTDLQGVPLIALMMVVTITATLWQAMYSQRSRMHRFLPLVLAWPPILLALLWLIPSAMELGKRMGTLAEQRVIAQGVFWGHVYCFVSLTGLAIWAFLDGTASRRPQR
jgi:hypothetical protein